MHLPNLRFPAMAVACLIGAFAHAQASNNPPQAQVDPGTAVREGQTSNKMAKPVQRTPGPAASKLRPALNKGVQLDDCPCSKASIGAQRVATKGQGRLPAECGSKAQEPTERAQRN